MANAVGIPSNLAVSPELSLDVEVRRRVWHCIGVLDLQSAFDRGSKPLLKSSDLNDLPLNVDDSELDENEIGSQPYGETRWTDMSLSLIIYQAGVCQRLLTEIGSSAACESSGNVDPIEAGYEQVAVLAEFDRHVQQLSGICSDSPVLVQRFAIAVGQESLVAMTLLMHRPLHRRGNGFVPAEYSENFNLLETATEVLERSQMKRSQPEFARWAWFQWV